MSKHVTSDGTKLYVMGNFLNIWVCESIFKRFAPEVNLLLRFTSSQSCGGLLTIYGMGDL